MKKIILPLCLALSYVSGADDSLRQEIEALKAQMVELKNAQSKINIDALKAQISEVKAHDANDNIKWSVDLRTSYDAVDYKIKGLSDQDNGVWTNKLILGMAAQPADNLVFKGSLGAYKAFGQTNLESNSMFQTFDWYGTQKPSDSAIKLREAYFLYFGNMGDMPYTASFGRRPSIDGFLTNLRADNENPASPIGHNINMEFDGASFKFDLDKLTGISGMYVKLCLGRGFSETRGSYSASGGGFAPSYSEDGETPNMDLVGVMFQAYDNGQYKVMANYFKGFNMMDLDYASYLANKIKFVDVGDLSGGALSLQVNGIGDGISDFLDDTIVFASFAWSETDPSTSMLGSQSDKTGTSYYAGIQIPGFGKGQRFGAEYNHGSKYWRSFTYGEDTLVGSKLAARGDAYEIYYTLPLVGKNLTAQLSYLYIDYDYTGSDTFFGWTGTPQDVNKATATGAV